MVDSVDITRVRGDTVADQVTVQDAAGAVVDIAGASFILTVDTIKDPTDALTNVYFVAGILVDAPNGLVEFVPTSTQSDQVPGTYFYDVQMIDAGGRIKTILKGKYKYTQDITK